MSNKPSKITVLIVDDSKSEQQFLKRVLTRDQNIEVVGTVSDGRAAISAAASLSPNVITMDLNMPGMNGLEVTRHIMGSKPIPIIIVTGDRSMTSAENAFKLVDAGAVGFVDKPSAFNETAHDDMCKQLCRLVRTMAHVKLVQRKSMSGDEKPFRILPPVQSKPIDYIVIGASTGGPAVLKYLVETIAVPVPVPILLVQHMTSGFMPGFVKWLNSHSRLPVKLAEHEEIPVPNCLYVAPDDYYMALSDSNRFSLSPRDSKDYRLLTVSHFFRSIAERKNVCVLAIILTGMGSDGAAELKLLRERGDTTIAQDKETSVVHGMPGEAIKLKAAQYEMNPTQIVDFINRIFGQSSGIDLSATSSSL